MKKRIGVVILTVALIPLLVLNIWCGIMIRNISSERAELKKDYSEINAIKYGILSVDAWRTNIQIIIANRIDDFTLTPDQAEILRLQISRVLNSMITEADSIIQNHGHSLGGKIRRLAVNTFVDIKDVRKHVPDFTEAIMLEMKKPENRQKLKELVESKVNEYASKTYDSTLYNWKLNALLTKYGATTIDDFNDKTSNRIQSLQDKTYMLSFVMIGSLLLVLLVWLITHKNKRLRRPLFVFSTLLASIVLVVGLVTPMIEIDARIKKMDFLLVGEHLQFHDQVIFYQSKSILQVVDILFATKKADSVLVGSLILLFSIIFPISKLVSTEIYLLSGERLKRNKLIYFLAFKSGKWSMADVMVVAIFMAYIGFKGILNSQLQYVNMETESLQSISTNQTSLQPGFIVFLSFVLFNLMLSEILKRIEPPELRKITLVKQVQ